MSRRSPLLLVLLAVVFVAVLPPRAASSAPLVGLVDRARQPGDLARLDPKTLKRTSRRVPMRGYSWGFGYSPNRSQLAIGIRRRGFSLQIVDLRRWRTRRVVNLTKIGGAPSAVSWPRPDRILALQGFGRDDGRSDLAVVDPVAGRMLRRVVLPGELRDAKRTATGLVVLSSPRGRIGRARLTIVDADGRMRTIMLARVQAGFVPPPRRVKRNRVPISHEVTPALVVDGTGTRAFVVAAGVPLVEEVDLASGAVTPHVVVPGAAGPARAAKLTEGMNRWAQWIGDGLLAVTGQDVFLNHDDRERIVPFGLQLLDTATWTMRRLASATTWFAPAPGMVLWSGERFDAASRKLTGGGLSTYVAATGKRLHSFGKTSVSSMIWGGRYLYVSVYRRHRTYVRDPARDRTVAVLPTGRPPFLFVDS